MVSRSWPILLKPHPPSFSDNIFDGAAVEVVPRTHGRRTKKPYVLATSQRPSLLLFGSMWRATIRDECEPMEREEETRKARNGLNYTESEFNSLGHFKFIIIMSAASHRDRHIQRGTNSPHDISEHAQRCHPDLHLLGATRRKSCRRTGCGAIVTEQHLDQRLVTLSMKADDLGSNYT